MIRTPSFGALTVLAAVLLSLSADAAYTRKSTSLLGAPARSADVVANLEPGTELTVIEIKGIWVKASIDDKEGWIRKLHISDTAPAGGSGGSSLGDAAGLATGRKGSGNVVTTTGVRGLDAEQLKSASFNEQELLEYLQLTVSKNQAKSFARAGGLEEQK